MYHPIFRAYKSLNNPKVVRKVRAILQSIRPDIVHAHNIHSHLSYVSLVEAHAYSKAVFLTVHDSMPFHYSKLFPSTVNVDDCNVRSYKVSPWKQIENFKWQYNPFRNISIRTYLKIPHKIFAVSEALAQALKDNGIENVEVLHNGIDASEWKCDEVVEKEPAIFFGGRLSRAKGGDVLVDVMKRVIAVRPETKLLLVGNIDEYTKSLVEKIGTENVVLAGPQSRENMKHMYAKSSLVVAPSLCFDWFPTVILEAMACSKPVVATCFGGSREMVVDGVTGYIVNPENIDTMTSKILELINDPLKAQSFGRAGIELVKSEFSLENHMKKLLSWYDRALKK